MRIMVASAFIMGCLLTASCESTHVYDHQVETHPSQGDVRVIDGTAAKLVTSKKGISVVMDTKELKPGNVYTLWVAIMNKPEECAQAPKACKPPDVLKHTAKTQSDVTYGDGIIAGADGTGTFRSFIPVGEISNSWFGNGLQNPLEAEIHLVVNEHGPVIRRLLVSMLTSYRGGCRDKSLPPPFPQTAKSDGIPGPNSCRLVQDVIFQQK